MWNFLFRLSPECPRRNLERARFPSLTIIFGTFLPFDGAKKSKSLKNLGSAPRLFSWLHFRTELRGKESEEERVKSSSRHPCKSPNYSISFSPLNPRPVENQSGNMDAYRTGVERRKDAFPTETGHSRKKVATRFVLSLAGFHFEEQHRSN